MKKKDLLEHADELKKNIENGKITNLVIIATNGDNIIWQQCANLVIASGLVNYGNFKMKQLLASNEKENDIKSMLGNIFKDK